MAAVKSKKFAEKAVKTSKSAPVKKTVSVKDVLTKSQILEHVSTLTTLSKKQVAHVLEALSELMHASIKPKGPGAFTLPGLLKINVIKKPAQKARKGINPFTGEEAVFKAKPARNVVKVRALKKLKDMASS